MEKSKRTKFWGLHAGSNQNFENHALILHFPHLPKINVLAPKVLELLMTPQIYFTWVRILLFLSIMFF
jgi:hypothetical protein